MNAYHKVISACPKVMMANLALMFSLACGSCSEQKGPTNTTATPNTNTTAQRASNAVVVGAQRVGAAAKTAGEKINDNAQKVGEKIGGAVEKTGDAVQSAAEKTYDAVKSGAEKAGEHI